MLMVAGLITDQVALISGRLIPTLTVYILIIRTHQRAVVFIFAVCCQNGVNVVKLLYLRWRLSLFQLLFVRSGIRQWYVLRVYWVVHLSHRVDDTCVAVSFCNSLHSFELGIDPTTVDWKLMFLLLWCTNLSWPVDVVDKDIAPVRKVWGSTLRLVKSNTLVSGSPPLRYWSCIVQALSRGDGFRLTLRASVKYCEYDEGSFDLSVKTYYFLPPGTHQVTPRSCLQSPTVPTLPLSPYSKLPSALPSTAKPGARRMGKVGVKFCVHSWHCLLYARIIQVDMLWD